MAGEGDAERLVVLVEARVRDLERNMQRAAGTTDTSYNRMRRGSRSATRQMEGDMSRSTMRINQLLATTSTRMGAFARAGLGGLTAGFAASLAPILSFGAALNGARSAMAEFNRIADKSNMLGVSAERLQELRFAAEQSGMAVDNFDTAFRRFIRRASEAAQGTGAAKSAFEELGISLTDSTGRLKDTDALLGEVANALQRVPQHADKLRLAFKMFDTDGAMMVNVLADGAAGLDEFARKARDLGIIIDNDVIARAADMQTEFDTATKVLDLQFKQVLIDLAPLLVDMAQFAANVAGGIRMITDAVKELMKEGPGAGFGGNQSWAELLTPEQRDAMNLRLRLGNKPGENLYEGFGFGDDGRIILAPPALPPGDDDSGTTTRNAAAKAALKQAEAVARIVANLKHEQDQLGRTTEEQELYNLLKAAGVERESEFGREIEATLGPLQAQREMIEQNAQVMKLFESAAESALDALVDGLVSGKDAGEALGNILRDLGTNMLKLGLRSILGGFNPLGFLMPGFSSGTPNTGGARGEVRGFVHGQEAVIPLPSGGQVPVQIQGGAGAGGHLSIETTIRVEDGNLVPVMTKVAGQVAGVQIANAVSPILRAARRDAPGAVAEAQMRGEWRF